MMPELQQARIVITNFHAFKLRETFEAAKGTRQALEGHGEALQTLETEGQMVQRVMKPLMGLKSVVVINDEAHHCYRERPGQPGGEADRRGAQGRRRKNKAAARMWISGLEALNRQQGVRVVYDLSATPFFLTGSNWPPRHALPLGDERLLADGRHRMRHREAAPACQSRTTGPTASRSCIANLWPAIRDRMPDKRKKTEGKPDPQKAAHRAEGRARRALRSLREDLPPVGARRGSACRRSSIVVCNNTTNSEMLRDYIAGYTRVDENDQETVVQGRSRPFQQLRRPLISASIVHAPS